MFFGPVCDAVNGWGKHARPTVKRLMAEEADVMFPTTLIMTDIWREPLSSGVGIPPGQPV